MTAGRQGPLGSRRGWLSTALSHLAPGVSAPARAPLVSVVIPVYNHRRFVRDAVESVDAQTFRDLELVIVDDGSTDGGWGEIQALGPLSMPVRKVRQDHAGTAAALNTAIRQAHGSHIAWLSSDDRFMPDKLAAQVAYLRAHPDVALVYADVYVDDELTGNSYLLRSSAFDDHARMVRELFRFCFINGSTTLVRRSAMDAVGGFDEGLLQAQDWDMWLRLSRDHRFGHIPLPLIRYRWHGGNLSLRDDAFAYHARVLEKARAWYRAGGLEPP